MRKRSDAPIIVGFIGLTGSILGVFALVLAVTPMTSMLFVLVTLFFKALPIGYGLAALQLTTPAGFRARITALYILFNAMIGGGLGPTLIALVTDFVLKDEAMLGWSLVIVTLVCMTLSFIALLIYRPKFIRLLSEHSEADIKAQTDAKIITI
jgi:hypothetical protein